MIRQIALASLGALVLSAATPAAAQDDFPSLNPRAKFAWAMRNFSQFCPVTTNRKVTFEELPPWMQAGLVAATKDAVIQHIKDNCPQIQALAAQY